MRIGALIAAGHFLVFHLVFGLLLLVPRGAKGRSVVELALLGIVKVLIAPATLLPIYGAHPRPALIFPPGSAIAVGFASIVWSIAVCLVLFVLQRFVRYRLSIRALQVGRRLALALALLSISWLFFGPVFGFAGDLMFGILDPARYMDGRFQVRPLWLIISALAWAASIFGSYRLFRKRP